MDDGEGVIQRDTSQKATIRNLPKQILDQFDKLNLVVSSILPPDRWLWLR